MYDAYWSPTEPLNFYKELLDHVGKIHQLADSRFIGAARSCVMASQQGIKAWRREACRTAYRSERYPMAGTLAMSFLL